MRSEIRQLIESGKTEAEIVEFYVARYGERILREPRGTLSLWLTIVPVLTVLAGGLFLANYIARFRGSHKGYSDEELPKLPDLDEE